MSARTSAVIFASPGQPANPHFLYAAQAGRAPVSMTAKANAYICLCLLI
jgi:hypothetical protein